MRTYANVAGPRGDPERTEYIMDEAETEEAAAGDGNDPRVEDAPQRKETRDKEVDAAFEAPALASIM